MDYIENTLRKIRLKQKISDHVDVKHWNPVQGRKIGVESDIDLSILFTETGFFIANKLAEYILTKISCKTVDKQLYYYNEKKGIYEEANDYLSSYITNILGDLQHTRRTKETIFIIKTKTITNNPEPPLNLLPVENGILNFNYEEKKVMLEPFTPHLFFTYKLPVKYDPDIKCPQIEFFLNTVIKQEDIPSILQFIGYTLTRTFKHDKFLLLIGEGDAGKTTFMNMLRIFLGGEENTTSISIQDMERHHFMKGYLYQKLANIVDDWPEDPVKHAGLFKQLTGGSPITFDRKFLGHVNFVNTAKMVFACNEPPPIKDDSHALWRRFLMVGFPYKFPEGDPNRDPDMETKITTPQELTGLLNMAIQGLFELEENKKFTQTLTIEETRERYMEHTDPVITYLENQVVVDIKHKHEKRKFYNLYLAWSEKKGIGGKSFIIFNRKIHEVYGSAVSDQRIGPKGDREYVWVGIRPLMVEKKKLNHEGGQQAL